MASWEDIVAKKQAALTAKIPDNWRLPEGFSAAPKTPQSPNLNITTGHFFLEALPGPARLSPQEYAITCETSIPAIQAKYRSHQWTAEELVTAFCHRAAISHQMTRSLAEIRFNEAIKEAKFQDDYLKTHNRLVGPFHGIPISVKDAFRVEGLETAAGHVGWAGKIETAETESLLVQQVKTLGGIIIAKAFNNLFGLKPSHGRFSYKNLARTLAGKPVVPAVAGPMSTSVENLIHVAKAMIQTEGWGSDPALINMPWRSAILDDVRDRSASGGLCFAALPHDGVVRPHPTVARGVEIAIDAVQQAGHQVIEWNPPSHLAAAQIYAGTVFATVYDIFDALKLSGEPMTKGVQRTIGMAVAPENMSLKEYYELLLKLDRFQQEYAVYWESTTSLTGTSRPVDGIITPVASTAAVRHDSFYAYNYTIVWNVLDYSAVTVPVTFADKNVDVAESYPRPLNDIDKFNWKAYDAEIYHGAPIGVQVVGRRHEEEKVLALGEVVSNALGSARNRGRNSKI
ncbi:unnamed protein product [Clonostachys rosea]|uniref:Amidase domain-containing protein n=1 Tax=Bionectria ochroleuca TaxID=29856 RepID=A0ABY6UMK8_BIOOC|nr:unnamed protein product [Clonostachys rosea]